MNLKKVIPLVTVAVLAFAAVMGAGVYKTVQAAAPAVAAAASNVTLMNGRGPQGGVDNTALAAALGITTDKLTAAYTSADTEAIKQAVAKGLITQAQADQYTTNGDSRFLDWNLFAQNGIDENTLLAQALGITTDQLTAAYQKAFTTSIDAQVTAGTLTQAQADSIKSNYALANSSKFQSAMQSAYQAAVNQAVTDGLITQAQADAILKNSASYNFGGMLPLGSIQGRRGGFGGMGGPGGGHGGRGGPGGFGPQNNNGSSTTPATPATPQATPGGA